MDEIEGAVGPGIEEFGLCLEVILLCFNSEPGIDEEATERQDFCSDVEMCIWVGTPDRGDDNVVGYGLVLAGETVSVVRLPVEDCFVEANIPPLLVGAEMYADEFLIVREDVVELEVRSDVDEVDEVDGGGVVGENVANGGLSARGKDVIGYRLELALLNGAAVVVELA